MRLQELVEVVITVLERPLELLVPLLLLDFGVGEALIPICPRRRRNFI